MNDDDPISAPVIANRPHHMFWDDLKRIFPELSEADLLRAEGIMWLRGHVQAETPEWEALISARALVLP